MTDRTSLTLYVGLVLAGLRRKRGWSQAELSRRLRDRLGSIGNVTVSRTELGLVNHTVERLEAYAQVLGCRLSTLLRLAEHFRTADKAKLWAVPERKFRAKVRVDNRPTD